jgi:hypothetical protein
VVTKSAGELITKSRIGVARGVVVPSTKTGMVTTQKPKEKKSVLQNGVLDLVTDPMPIVVENKNVTEFVADGPTETTLVVATTVQDSNAESATPTKAMKRKYFNWEDNVPLEPCSNGRNHVWDEFAKGGSVITGFLSGSKRCIGERGGRVCGRLFVEKSICPKVNESDKEFNPTCKRPAYGCTICFNGMCFECKISMRST